MSRILYQHPDGSVAVIIPAPDCGLTIEEIAAKDVPQGLTWQIVDEADIPTDRTFRNAWCLKNGHFDHDLDKCCAITKDRLRAERKPLLELQDVLFMRSVERGENTSTIAGEKQRLRDVTKLVTTDMTLEQMKELHP